MISAFFNATARRRFEAISPAITYAPARPSLPIPPSLHSSHHPVIASAWYYRYPPQPTTMKNRSFPTSLLSVAFVLLALFGLFVGAAADADADAAAKVGEVRVEVTKPGTGPFLVKGNTYATFLTLYYVNDQGEKTFSGFTTREDDGGPQGNTIFELQPGIDTIEGVTIGSQKMREGSRANLHIPSALAYGDKQMGRPGGGLYVPGGADIIFDIEVFGRVDPNGPGWFMDEDVGRPRQREEL